ncbi:uncharacterized protein BJ212DRAFT_1574327 [Suillus subaureus]|uniref:HAT C-terminal dimerisation domain-containing protein n=1 Tax=Suillus subaureus TaxID=48587 RepID=A0A9P7EJM6_9AGAM|nr:uncharacterized protein BJ212DRAFT_1574327 [Suillus subaureus]KAG1823727.1 hypothetical protein BJ212DRAFT_1574327 [Suillus subaureus]
MHSMKAYFRAEDPFNRKMRSNESPRDCWLALLKSGDEFADVLPIIAIKMFSAVPISMADERTMSTITWLNSPRRANQNLETLQNHIKIRQWHRYKPECTASDMDMAEDLPLPGRRPPQPRPFNSNPPNDAGDPRFPDDGAEWLNDERGLPSEFEKVDGSYFLLGGANADIELRSPYLWDFLDETPRNVNSHAKVLTTSSIVVSSLSLEALPDATAWDVWP